MKEQKIHCTNDYKRFSSHPLNRPISSSHVGRMIDSMKRENLLHIHPIIVNENYQIVCGQHRFEAAKTLNAPIWYMVHNCSDEHILHDNLASDKTEIDAVLDYHVKKHTSQMHQFLHDTRKKVGLSTGTTLCLLGYLRSHSFTKILNDGTLKFKDGFDKCNDIVDKYNDFRSRLFQNPIENKHIFQTAGFCMAFYRFCKLKINWKHFLPRIASYWKKIDFKGGTVDDYYKALISINNLNARTNAISV